MRKYLKLCSFVLVAALLCSCGAEQTAEPTETTAPSLTTQNAVQAALDDGGRVTLGGDLEVTEGLVVKDVIFDGGGHTITGPVYDEDVVSSSCAVLVTRCTVENITVKNCYRAIGSNKENRCSGEIRIKKVVADGEKCALYIGQADNMGKVIVADSTFGGQTVFNKVKEASFDNCTFTWNESGTKGNMTAYTDATIVNCRFESKADGTKYKIAFPSSVDGHLMVLEDCYVGDTLITEENIKDLLTVKTNSNRIEVRNTVK